MISISLALHVLLVSTVLTQVKPLFHVLPISTQLEVLLLVLTVVLDYILSLDGVTAVLFQLVTMSLVEQAKSLRLLNLDTS